MNYLVITNELKTIKDSKLLFLVYFSIFIIYLDVAILYFIIHFSITNYQCNVILAILLNYELFILIILGVLIFNLIIYFMISQTWFYIFIYFLILYLNLRFDRWPTDWTNDPMTQLLNRVNVWFGFNNYETDNVKYPYLLSLNCAHLWSFVW